MIPIKAIEGRNLYKTTFGSLVFTYRLLTIKEFEYFSRQQLPAEIIYSQIFDICYLGDSSLLNGNIPAGCILSVGQVILHLSNSHAGQEKEAISQSRSEYNEDSVIEYMKRIVLIAFDTYNPDHIYGWSYKELYDKFVIAESVLAMKSIINKDGYTPVDLKTIRKAGEVQKPNGIDFQKENMAIRETGVNDNHMLDQTPMAMSHAQKQKINPQQARQLDKKTRR